MVTSGHTESQKLLDFLDFSASQLLMQSFQNSVLGASFCTPIFFPTTTAFVGLKQAVIICFRFSPPTPHFYRRPFRPWRIKIPYCDVLETTATLDSQSPTGQRVLPRPPKVTARKINRLHDHTTHKVSAKYDTNESKFVAWRALTRKFVQTQKNRHDNCWSTVSLTRRPRIQEKEKK